MYDYVGVAVPYEIAANVVVADATVVVSSRYFVTFAVATAAVVS